MNLIAAALMAPTNSQGGAGMGFLLVQVGLIFAVVGKQVGVVSEQMFSVIVVVVILTTLLTPPILTALLRRRQG